VSDFGSIMDQLVTEARDAVATLTAANCERGIRQGEELGVDELPHLFVHSPQESIELLDFQQERRSFVCTLDLWVQGDTQDQLATKLDGIRDQIAANRSLSGAADYATVTLRQVFEFPARERKVGRIEVLAVKDY
jgi:hypothetical protein